MRIKSNLKRINDYKINSNKVLTIYIIISIISFFFCFVYASETDKSFLALLPICYIVSTIFLYKTKKNIEENISILLIEAFFFVRMSVIPLLYSFNIDGQLFESSLNVCSHFKEACLLMIYEFIAIQSTIVLHLSLSKKKYLSFKTKKVMDPKISDYLVYIMALFIVVCAIFLNSYIPTFKTIFSLGDYEFTIADSTIYNIGSFGRVINTLFIIIFQLFRILFPAFLLKKCYSKNSKHSLFVLVTSCFLQFMFLTSTFAEAIVSCLCLVLYYIKLYPEKKEKMLLFLLLSTIGVFLLFFIVRFFVKADMNLYDKNNPIIYAGQMTNAYFTGVDNVSATLNVRSIHKLEAFKADLIGAIPFNSTIFGNKGNKFHYFYNEYNEAYGQIPPTIGVGYYMFGALFAPIISIIFTKISLVYFEKSVKIKESFEYVATIFCSIIFAFGTAMYSPAITLSLYFSWGIPMLLISHYSNIE